MIEQVNGIHDFVSIIVIPNIKLLFNHSLDLYSKIKNYYNSFYNQFISHVKNVISDLKLRQYSSLSGLFVRMFLLTFATYLVPFLIFCFFDRERYFMYNGARRMSFKHSLKICLQNSSFRNRVLYGLKDADQSEEFLYYVLYISDLPFYDRFSLFDKIMFYSINYTYFFYAIFIGPLLYFLSGQKNSEYEEIKGNYRSIITLPLLFVANIVMVITPIIHFTSIGVFADNSIVNKILDVIYHPLSSKVNADVILNNSDKVSDLTWLKNSVLSLFFGKGYSYSVNSVKKRIYKPSEDPFSAEITSVLYKDESSLKLIKSIWNLTSVVMFLLTVVVTVMYEKVKETIKSEVKEYDSKHKNVTKVNEYSHYEKIADEKRKFVLKEMQYLSYKTIVNCYHAFFSGIISTLFPIVMEFVLHGIYRLPITAVCIIAQYCAKAIYSIVYFKYSVAAVKSAGLLGDKDVLF